MNWRRTITGSLGQSEYRARDFAGCGALARRSDNKPKSGLEAVVRNAEEPGQTLNIDLCFVPSEHEVLQKLPAVSGSSGRLVVEKTKLSEP